MKKAIYFFLISCLIASGAALPPAEAAAQFTAPSAVLLDPASGKVLYSKAPHRRQPPASTAKLMTALVVLDHLDLNQWVRVSAEVEAVEPSKLYLHDGERLRVRGLLKAALMKSANDAAMQLAISVSGSEAAFAELMTEKARSLGARDTVFKNASGLPQEEQYSTAYDMALIMRAAKKNRVISSILKQKSTVIQNSAGKRYFLKSHNKMLWRTSHVTGKTGWTRSARYCFVGLIQIGTREVIISMLGSRKLWDDVTVLYRRVRAMFGLTSLLSEGNRGSDVRKVQAALKKAGYFKAKPTGYFGTVTKKAVTRFQKAKGLKADGIVGPKTQRALQPYL